MKKIPLTQGQVALVDDADFEALNRHKWYAQKYKNGFYAQRGVARPGGGQTVVIMHRVILSLEDPRIQGDHRDGNGLNNQRYNLRIATNLQNGRAFKTPRVKATSRFRGVCWHKQLKRWQAAIKVSQVNKYLGLFADEEGAARAYDKAALEHFGEFTQLNLPNTPTA